MSTDAALSTSAIPQFNEALKFWTRLGFISFGGPAGQIAIMHDELVTQRRWVSESQYMHALNYCMLLPGPEAQQLATYMGWVMHGTLGGIAAGLLFILPSTVLLIALAWIYCAFGHTPWIAGALAGAKPAVVAIVIAALYRVGTRTLRRPWAFAVAAASFVALSVLHVPFPLLIGVAALIGAAVGSFRPGWLVIGTHGPGLEGEANHPPRVQRSKVWLAVGVGLGLWIISIYMIRWIFGAQSPLFQMGWFFTKSALVTFGGAYAVLPYIYQGFVNDFRWVTPAQMVDGLALGETTPGPLIMVVAFVGFVAAWNTAPLGADLQLSAALLAGLIAVFFTFLPSFVFILAGAPLVQATQGNLKFTAPLAGITAAVVGVIASLAVFFAYHVFWPEGFAGSLRVLDVIIAIVALVALIRFKVSSTKVVIACALIAIALRLANVS